MADKTRFAWGVAEIDQDNSGQQGFMMVNGPTAKGVDLNIFQEIMAKVSSENQFYIKPFGKTYLNMDKKYRLYNDMVGRGLAVGDLNNDGQIDMVISNRDDKAQMIVYKNNNKLNHSLRIQLEGGGGINKMAIGAKVSVFVGNKVQHKLLSAGSSFLSQNSSVLHFGLGKNIVADKIIISWPNGKKQVLHNIAADGLIKIKYKPID